MTSLTATEGTLGTQGVLRLVPLHCLVVQVLSENINYWRFSKTAFAVAK